MKTEDFLNWRKTLRYTQEEAGGKLGVDRSTIQNWERGITRLPRIAELACQELMRRWKQRPEFGPVTLVYADEPMRPRPDYPTRAIFVHSELYPNNEVAIRRTLRLRETAAVANPFIIEQDGGIVWSTPDLLLECDRRRERARAKRRNSGTEAIEGQDQKAPSIKDQAQSLTVKR
jgi:transcriptional regulator with XRE-family HTH domain